MREKDSRQPNPVITFISAHGFGIMMAGFFIAVIGVLFHVQNRLSNEFVSRISLIVAIAGFAVYVIGRIGVVFQRKKILKKHPREGHQ